MCLDPHQRLAMARGGHVIKHCPHLSQQPGARAQGCCDIVCLPCAQTMSPRVRCDTPDARVRRQAVNVEGITNHGMVCIVLDLVLGGWFRCPGSGCNGIEGSNVVLMGG